MSLIGNLPNYTTNVVDKMDEVSHNHPSNLEFSCIDYRFTNMYEKAQSDLGLGGEYDICALAGASLGYNQQQYPAWSQTLDDHINISIKLHNIKSINVFDHMDCGAYKLFYQKDSFDPETEKLLHINHLYIFKKTMALKFPQLIVNTFLIQLNGTIEQISFP